MLPHTSWTHTRKRERGVLFHQLRQPWRAVGWARAIQLISVKSISWRHKKCANIYKWELSTQYRFMQTVLWRYNKHHCRHKHHSPRCVPHLSDLSEQMIIGHALSMKIIQINKLIIHQFFFIYLFNLIFNITTIVMVSKDHERELIDNVHNRLAAEANDFKTFNIYVIFKIYYF